VCYQDQALQHEVWDLDTIPRAQEIADSECSARVLVSKQLLIGSVWQHYVLIYMAWCCNFSSGQYGINMAQGINMACGINMASFVGPDAKHPLGPGLAWHGIAIW
jgi:hypothetical protein